MNFNGMKTDELLACIPQDDENDQWELKGAQLLEPSNTTALKNMLGKQVSGFANSGGGQIIIGIDETDRAIQNCELTRGRQSMKDFLANEVYQCVSNPLSDFRVFRIEESGAPGNSIYLIKIGDSQAAPHQANFDKKYYQRIDGHTKPAPHFYIELLRNRTTRTLLEIVKINWHVRHPKPQPPNQAMLRIPLTLNLTVENKSIMAATSWGVALKAANENDWLVSVKDSKRYLRDSVCVHGEHAPLLPYEQANLSIQLECLVEHSANFRPAVRQACRDFQVLVNAVSHDCMGDQMLFKLISDAERFDQAMVDIACNGI